MKYSRQIAKIFPSFDILIEYEDKDYVVNSCQTIEQALNWFKTINMTKKPSTNIYIEGCLEGYANSLVMLNGEWQEIETIEEA